MGRAPAVLNRRRAAVFAALAVALAVYYATSDSWPNVSTWSDVAFLGLVLVPAVFGLVYAVLPFWRAPLPQLALMTIAFAAVAAAFQSADLVEPASFAKLGATAAAAFVFLSIFESATWVALIAALIPWVDAYSVFWGPTSRILEHPKGVSALSFGTTTALAAWTNRALPATPLLSVAFLLANADLLWRQLRASGTQPERDSAPAD